ncbi:hypothetical protein [Aromatoleum petrolei]|uniref:Uncharacterized protein n=1 Tax=Aromatoleum petrolei TaxID=76116 RepID=A0ABX1MN23_9RHOO|nr:hypothetical protein [Aromatoleum petrolei]NMF88585.1 hypothetical protein [Aromatoleum petrolei]
MAYALHDYQPAIQDFVRRIARERVAPRADEIDRIAEYTNAMSDMPFEYSGTRGLEGFGEEVKPPPSNFHQASSPTALVQVQCGRLDCRLRPDGMPTNR